MLKKLLTATLIASVLVLPVSSAGLSNPEGASSPAQSQDYLPGDVPAQTDTVESMSPALHALVLAMLNHNAERFDYDNPSLTWEGLYNMLSLYGQLDQRSTTGQGELLLPEETVQDYAAALSIDPNRLGSLPASIRDRLNYDNVSRCYVVVCGEDDLAQIQVDSLKTSGSSCTLTGRLVYTVENEVLARFQATLQLQDNMFGYAVTSLTVTG